MEPIGRLNLAVREPIRLQACFFHLVSRIMYTMYNFWHVGLQVNLRHSFRYNNEIIDACLSSK